MNLALSHLAIRDTARDYTRWKAFIKEDGTKKSIAREKLKERV